MDEPRKCKICGREVVKFYGEENDYCSVYCVVDAKNDEIDALRRENAELLKDFKINVNCREERIAELERDISGLKSEVSMLRAVMSPEQKLIDALIFQQEHEIAELREKLSASSIVTTMPDIPNETYTVTARSEPHDPQV